MANIVSEFQTFARQIFTSWGNNKETADFLEDHANYLFAFIVYKNTHLTDYEKIQIGASNIDKINIKFLTMKLEFKIMSQELFKKLSDSLRVKIDKKYKVDSSFCSLSIKGKRFDDFTEVELWEETLDPNLPHNRTAISLIDRNEHIISDNIIDDFGSNIFSNLVANELTVKIGNNYQAMITSIKSINYIESMKLIQLLGEWGSVGGW